MKQTKLIALLGATAAMLTLSSCDVDKTQEGELPSVDVEGGQLPKYEVDAPDVDITTKEKTITAPDADVTIPDDDTDANHPKSQ
ncbi:MAG: hypothetical protein ACI8T1_004786 [Verrucomicrobiales bacterium]|jgi:hypothetical protein